ncbi:MAG TPA: DUF2934 domain-containing protein [Polyangiaceae bacterium]
METMQRANAIDPGLVRTKAYEIWQMAGCPVGVAEQNWLEAEQQLRAARADLARESARATAIAATTTVSNIEPISAPANEQPATRSDVPPSSASHSKAKKRSTRR